MIKGKFIPVAKVGSDSSAISFFSKGHATVIRKNVTEGLYVSHVTAETFIKQYSLRFLFQISMCFSLKILTI